MWPDYYLGSWESTLTKQEKNAKDISDRKSKKGKERKNWENKNTIWQDKRRFS